MHYLKRFIPKDVLSLLHTLRQFFYNSSDYFKPYLNKIKYCGFDVYYAVGEGLIDRIRWGSPDRIYERQMCEQIEALLSASKNPRFLDIGSNIGLVSMYLMSKVARLKIYAFEPGPHQFKLFFISIFANRLDESIDLKNMALGERAGSLNFKVHVDGKESSGDGFVDTQRAGPTKDIIVETITLDEWWSNAHKPNIDVVKIDTEGSELLILKGGNVFFKESKPTIFLEISLINLKNYPYTYNDIFSWFENNRYELFTINEEKCDASNFHNHLLVESSFVAKPTI